VYPQTYLKTFWRMELRPQVFVAMSFAPQYEDRFNGVIAPAIRSLTIDEQCLEPYRVDISKTGDSILNDISDGIAHSRLVLADVSCVGKDSVSGEPYRNANVMYEVGVALACRQPSEVLLVRDDHDKLLFDVSTTPHVTIDFTDATTAINTLREHLLARAGEQVFVQDARVQMAIASLSAEEITLLKLMPVKRAKIVWDKAMVGLANWYALATSRLLDKGVITLRGEFAGGEPAFAFTSFGNVIHETVKQGLPKFETLSPPKLGVEIALDTVEGAQPPAPVDSSQAPSS